MLKMTKKELELILDHDMYIFFENDTIEVEFIIFLIDIAKWTIDI